MLAHFLSMRITPRTIGSTEDEILLCNDLKLEQLLTD